MKAALLNMMQKQMLNKLKQFFKPIVPPIYTPLTVGIVDGKIVNWSEIRYHSRANVLEKDAFLFNDKLCWGDVEVYVSGGDKIYFIPDKDSNYKEFGKMMAKVDDYVDYQYIEANACTVGAVSLSEKSLLRAKLIELDSCIKTKTGKSSNYLLINSKILPILNELYPNDLIIIKDYRRSDISFDFEYVKILDSYWRLYICDRMSENTILMGRNEDNDVIYPFYGSNLTSGMATAKLVVHKY